MRDQDFDVKAFPILHPTGKFGLHHKRELKLNPVFYFTQRLLNKDQRFAKSIPYIFMAHQVRNIIQNINNPIFLLFKIHSYLSVC